MNILYSTGFRSPNIDDIGKIRENRGVLIIPNPELKPEYVYNFEGGLTVSNDDIFWDPHYMGIFIGRRSQLTYRIRPSISTTY